MWDIMEYFVTDFSEQLFNCFFELVKYYGILSQSLVLIRYIKYSPKYLHSISFKFKFNIWYQSSSRAWLSRKQQFSHLQQQDQMAYENNSFVQPAILHFDGHYDHWNMLMEKFSRLKDYWGLVENGIIEPIA